MDLTQDEKERIDQLAKIANSSYQRPEERPLYNVNYQLKDKFIYDNDSSDRYHAIYLDPQSNKIYMSIRGTELKRGYGEAITDLLDDSAVAVGQPLATRRYRASDKKYNDLKAKYPDMEIEVVGHSLGGTVGAELTKKYGVVSHNFNTGSGAINPDAIFDINNFNRFHEGYKEKTNYYHTGDFDLLSETSLVRPGNHHIYDVDTSGKGSHSLSNFYLASAEK